MNRPTDPLEAPGARVAGAPIAASVDGLSVAERVRLIRDGLLNYWGVLVSAVVGLAVVPIMLDRLGVERYGLWVVLLAAVALVGEIDFGLSAIVTREVAADPDYESEDTAELVSAAAGAYLLLGIVGGLLLTAVGTAVDHGLELSATARHGLFLFAMGGLLSLAGRALAFSIALLYGWRRFGTANAIPAALAIVSGAGTVFILLGGGGLRAVAAWQAASFVVVAAVTLAATRRIRRNSMSGCRSSWRALRPQLRFGISSQVLTLSVNLLWVAAPTLVGAISGPRLVASYDVGRRFPFVLSTLSWRSSEAFFPAASRESRVGTLRRRQDVLEANMRWNLVLVLPLSILLWVLAPNLFEVWLNTPPPDAVFILRVLVVAIAVDAVGAACLQVLWAAARMRALLGLLGLTTLAGIGLTAVLVWQLGAAGAPIALLTAIVIRSALLLGAASREHGIRLAVLMATLGRGLFLPVGACAGMTVAASQAANPRDWASLVTVGFFGLAAYLLAVALGQSRDEEKAILSSAGRAPGKAGRLLYRGCRRLLRGVTPLRSSWYLLHELLRMSGPRSRPTAALLDREFEARIDPWDYGRPAEQERHLTAVRMLDAVRSSRSFENAVEIGCAEGMFTEHLVPRCQRLLALDISSVALERARTRCTGENVQFERWNLLNGEELGPFDLVVAMDVLDYLLRPADLRRASSRIRRMLLPGGYLLVSTTKQSDVFETAWWRRWIRRGRMINESLGSLAGLRALQNQTTEAHSIALYVRTGD